MKTKQKPKPRLSMKLLWQMAYTEQGKDLPHDAAIATFLFKVQEKMKSPLVEVKKKPLKP